jgi:hypothetical protein
MTMDDAVRRVTYDVAMSTGTIPTVIELARILGMSNDEVRASLKRLAEARVLVLQRDSGEILMAPPFSAVPTPFVVRGSELLAWGNCIWDALGILAMVRSDGVVETSCGCCGEAMLLQVEHGTLRNRDGVVHFAVPARHWWNDIVFT